MSKRSDDLVKQGDVELGVGVCLVADKDALIGEADTFEYFKAEQSAPPCLKL